MSELKFACPVCGQHIRCDSTRSGTQMECPTCFRKMVVPQAPTGADSKLVLAAAAVSQRPVPGPPVEETPRPPAPSRFRRVAAVTALLVLAGAAAGAVFAFREKIFRPAGQTRLAGRPAPPGTDPNASPAFPLALAGTETNWTLNLGGRAIPGTEAAGQLHRREFAPDRVTVQGGTLTFRQGYKTPQEMAATVYLHARQAEDLAGQTISVDTSWTNAPKVTLRWKDEQQQPVTRTYRDGYALKLEFGTVANGRLPGRIYLCLPDGEKSFLAGAFTAEIRKPPPPKAPLPNKPTTPQPPRR